MFSATELARVDRQRMKLYVMNINDLGGHKARTQLPVCLVSSGILACERAYPLATFLYCFFQDL